MFAGGSRPCPGCFGEFVGGFLIYGAVVEFAGVFDCGCHEEFFVWVCCEAVVFGCYSCDGGEVFFGDAGAGEP